MTVTHRPPARHACGLHSAVKTAVACNGGGIHTIGLGARVKGSRPLR